MYSPVASSTPRAVAALRPAFSWRITRMRSPNVASTAGVPSVEPSSTTRISSDPAG